MQARRVALGFILIIYSLLATAYALRVPIFEASDEAEHFIHIHTILETGALPVIQSRDEMNNQTDPVLRWNNQSHHAPLYYLTSAALISWSQRADLADYLQANELIFLRNTTENNANKWLHRYTAPRSDTHLALAVLRTANILLGLGTLLLVYRAALILSQREAIALASTFLIASLPTFLVVHSSVSNDPLVIFLYSAGLLWTLRVWRAAAITTRDVILLALILGGIALTKLTGVSLFGVVYLALLTGALWGRWSWRAALQAMVISGLAALLLAGWWYWRNLTLYGDPLAADATASIWGRGNAFDLATLPDDLLRIYKSFWLMVGYLHQPVFAPDSAYLYLTAFTLIGIGGFIWHWRQKRDAIYLWPLLAFAVLLALLLYGTRSVDISYGRLLLPSAAAFAPLLMIGWWHLLGRWSILLTIPLMALALYAPLVLIPHAYPTLQAVTASDIPADAVRVGWQADDLQIVAVDWQEPSAGYVQPQQTLRVDLYFRGSHPDNPALLVTTVDSVRTARLAHLEIYPGMAATASLPEDGLWRVPLRLSLGTVDRTLPPRVVMLLFEWVNLEDNRAIVFDSGQSLLEIVGPTLIDSAYDAPQGVPLATFTEADAQINLIATDLPATATSGDVLSIELAWQTTSTPTYDWTLTLQLIDAAGDLVTQNDGVLWWYPTSRWTPAVAFDDTRTLSLPADLPAGNYTLRAGWYRKLADASFTRMTIDHPQAIDNLLTLGSIQITNPE